MTKSKHYGNASSGVSSLVATAYLLDFLTMLGIKSALPGNMTPGHVDYFLERMCKLNGELQ